jgi:phosphoglycerate dehydrogenase-like enzyme
MLASLRSGHLAGAALDVYDREPLPADSPLRTTQNVVLSPHVAAQTTDAVRAMGFAAARAILTELAGERPLSVYNPEVYAVRAGLGVG